MLYKLHGLAFLSNYESIHLYIGIVLNERLVFYSISSASATRYRLDSFKDSSNKVVYLVNNYLNYTKEVL